MTGAGPNTNLVPRIDISFDVSEPRKSAQKIIPSLLPNTVEGDETLCSFEIEPVTGGITNTLFKCTFAASVDGSKPGPVIVRVFGGEGIIDRVKDNLVFIALSNAGLGPRCYGTFTNGRVEEFFEGCKTLSCDDLGDETMARGIAVELARIHRFQPPPEAVDPTGQPALWSQIWGWHDKAVNVKFEAGTAEAADLEQLGLQLAEKELRALQAAVPDSCPLAFCNNDLLAANVLIQEATGKIHLIDFEYGGLNYRGFDIANHFNEYAGGTDNGQTDYSKFPSESHVRSFCEAYLEEYSRGQTEAHTTPEELLAEVNVFVLIDHWYWGLWAVNMAATKGCADFPYLVYSRNRLNEYWRKKSELLS